LTLGSCRRFTTPTRRASKGVAFGLLPSQKSGIEMISKDRTPVSDRSGAHQAPADDDPAGSLICEATGGAGVVCRPFHPLE
jgi:hypothetical protein